MVVVEQTSQSTSQPLREKIELASQHIRPIIYLIAFLLLLFVISLISWQFQWALIYLAFILILTIIALVLLRTRFRKATPEADQ